MTNWEGSRSARADWGWGGVSAKEVGGGGGSRERERAGGAEVVMAIPMSDLFNG